MKLQLFVFSFLFALSGQASNQQALNKISAELNLSSAGDKAILCKAKLLTRLGFKFSTEASSSSVNYGSSQNYPDGTVCQANNTGHAIDNGLLHIRLQENAGKVTRAALDDFSKLSHDIINSADSMCAFKIKFGQAIDKATADLAKMAKVPTDRYGRPTGPAHYSFPNSSLSTDFAKLPRSWQVSSAAHYYTPVGVSASEGLNDLKKYPFQTECAAGLQLSELYSLWYLYKFDMDGEAVGEANFNQAFSAKQMAIGTWEGVARSSNPFRTQLDKNVKEVADKTGAASAQFGKHGLTGVTGYIGKKKWELALNSPSDRGENFIVVSMSNRAAAEITKNGVETLNYYAHEAWLKFGKKFKFGFVQPRPDLAKAYLAQIPVFNEVKVFVHPLGLKTLGEHIARLIGVNPATAYNFQFYPNRVNYEIYNQYINFHYQNCLDN